MDGVDPGEVASRATQEREEQRSHAKTVLEWFLADERLGEMYPRGNLITELSSQTDLDREQAASGVRGTVGDVVDPVQQVTAGNEKYVGVIEYRTYPDAGAYGYVQYHDRLGERKRVVCAKCVEEADLEENVSHATEGKGTAPDDCGWDVLLERVESHYEEAHDGASDSIEPGASLVSNTTIGGNTAFHAGNDGTGSGMDADTLQGNLPGDIGSGGVPLIDEAKTFTEPNVTLGGDYPFQSNDEVGVFLPNISAARSVAEETYNTKVNSIRGMLFNSDGTKFYIVDRVRDLVAEYNLSTPYDITTQSHVQFLNTNGNPSDAAFSPDTTELAIASDANGSVFRYSLSTAGDLTTASQVHELDISSETSQPRGVAWANSGNTLLVLDENKPILYRYIGNTSYRLSEFVFQDSIDLSADVGSGGSIRMSDDGTKMFIADFSNNAIVQYTLSTAGDPVDGVTVDATLPTDTIEAVALSGQEDRIYRGYDGQVTEFSMAPQAGDTTEVRFDPLEYVGSWGDFAVQTRADGASVSVDVQDFNATRIESALSTSASGLTFADSGSRLYLADVFDGKILEYLLSSPYDLSTATLANTFDTGNEEGLPRSVDISPDGTSLAITGDLTNMVHVYSLSTAYDLSTATFQAQFDSSAENSDMRAMTFADSGTRMYLAGDGPNSLIQYSLSTAYDPTTATKQNTGFFASSENDQPAGVEFNDDGTKMFVVDGNNATVLVYSLSTGYDITTRSLTSEFTDSDVIGSGLDIADGGSVLASNAGGVNQLSLRSAYQFEVTIAADTSDLTDISGEPTLSSPGLRLVYESVPRGSRPRIEYVARRGDF